MNNRTSRGIPHTINWSFHLFFGGFILSVMLGSVFCTLYPAWEIWQNPFFTQGMGISFPTYSMSGLMIRLCVIPIAWMILVAVSGMSLTGIPITGFLFLLRASALGCVLTQLYADEGIQTIAYVLLFVMPYALISSLLYILGIREASRFSLSLVRILRKSNNDEVNLRLYLMRLIVLILLMIVTGIIQCFWLRYVYCKCVGL